MSWRWLELLLLLALLTPAVQGQDLDEVMAGHWVVVKGNLREDDLFVAEEVELSRPEDDEEQLIGTVTEVAEVAEVEDGGAWFLLHGMRVHVDEDTRWRNLELEQLVGARVKVSGHYHGPRKFSASSVSARGAGRDRLVGRVDARRMMEGEVELDVMRWRVRVPAAVPYEREEELEDYPLLEQRGITRRQALRRSDSLRSGRDDDDDIPLTLRLSDTLALGLRLDMERTDEREYDLDGADAEDRIDDEASLRMEVLWSPDEHFYALLGMRHGWRWRDDEQDGQESTDRGRVSELYGYWKDLGGLPLDLQLGRQDFDEPREWLWDQNLDAVRLIWYPALDWRLELATATTVRDGNVHDEATERYMAYLRWGDDDHSVGAYVLDTRTDLGVDDYPFHVGVRALGEWWQGHDLWLELAGVTGYEGDQDLRGYGFDLGDTWSPEALDPYYFSAGYAFGSGDDDPSDDVDGNFRQTGLQDNNGKFGGVTSFRYYGELLRPELSNLGVITLGVGRRFGRAHSLDLVYHRYDQDVAADRLRDVDLKRRPDGVHTDLGQELDLVFGSRVNERIHLEVVLAAFDPGAAFPDDAEDAFLARVQLRFRF